MKLAYTLQAQNKDPGTTPTETFAHASFDLVTMVSHPEILYTFKLRSRIRINLFLDGRHLREDGL